jgi:hypothetical protein
MKCPYCKEKLDHVDAYSECKQKATLNIRGKITEIGKVEDILDSTDYECPHCRENVSDMVKEQ